jgi:hypothetical protein
LRLLASEKSRYLILVTSLNVSFGSWAEFGGEEVIW